MQFQPTVILLSAKDNERLLEQVRQLTMTIEKKELTDKDLPNISFTLSVGREHMEERLAFIVNNITDLKGKLELYIAGDRNIDEFYQGSANSNHELVSVFSNEEELELAVENLLMQRKYGKVLELWTKGVWIEWAKLYQGLEVRPHSISLPTYPFAKDQYWISTKRKQSLVPVSQTGTIHPFVHENTSDLRGQRFSSVFTGTEDFLNSIDENYYHIPESIHIEMIRVAAQRSMAVRKDSTIVIQDVEWIDPVVVSQNTMVHMALYPEADGSLEWEIYTEVEGSEEEPEVRSEGKVSVIEIESMVTSPLNELQAQYTIKHSDNNSNRMDQYIEEVRTDDTEQRSLLVRFKDMKEKENQGYKEREVLDIDLLEACLESANVYLSNKSGSNRLYSMKKIEIPVQAGQPLWGVINIKNSEQDSLLELDIVLYDQAENVVAAITGLRYQNQNIEEVVPPIKSKTEPKEQYELMTFEEKWEESALTLEEKQLHSVVVLVTDENRRQVIERNLKQLNPEITINFIGFGESYQKESTNRYTVHYGDKSGYVACLKDIMTSVGKVDAVLYLWPTEEEKWITDSTGILYLLQGIAEAKVKPDRVLLAGGYQDDLERSHLESWIGIERSTGLVMPGTKVSIIIANRNETL
ncbi:beta-ketoacyl synthase, partial [Ornithinibacillus scapharcae]|uniref:KS-MAT linker domain-containing protein n=1 Tax=Ornithinibacillus scapharcae TaxID=1147159 RepID=UPI000225B8B5